MNVQVAVLVCVLAGAGLCGCAPSNAAKPSLEGERTPLTGDRFTAHRADAERRAKEWFKILQEERLLGESADGIPMAEASMSTSDTGESGDFRTTVTWLVWADRDTGDSRSLGLAEAGGVSYYLDERLNSSIMARSGARKGKMEAEWPIAVPESNTASSNPFEFMSSDPFAAPPPPPSPEWKAFREELAKREAAYALALLDADDICQSACRLLRRVEPIRWRGFKSHLLRIDSESGRATLFAEGRINGFPSENPSIFLDIDAVDGRLICFVHYPAYGVFPTLVDASVTEDEGSRIVRTRLDSAYRFPVKTADIRYRRTFIAFERDAPETYGLRFLDRPAIVHEYRANTNGEWWDDVLVNAQTGEIFDWSHIMLIAGPEMWAKMEEDESDGACDCADIAD